ncbi:MAG: hypothetical protein HRT58_08145 [Crocinitomicaceae bacterium]|nr:hypothetical protein [Flavobacteriales bacterium]NQZ35619.1 hypothetical protein [Crocinitomicaceae bacterium]
MEQTVEEHLGKPSLIKVKYLQNLWSDIKSGIKSEQETVKQDDYISELLNLCGFLSWIEFEEEIDKVESFIHEYPSLSKFEEISIVILTTEKEEERIVPFLSFHRKIIDLRVQLKQANSEKLLEIQSLLENNAYVVSYFSHKAEESDIHPIKEELWSELTSTNRFVPVWDGNDKSSYTIEGVAKHQQVIGLRGLMLSVLILNVAKDKKGNSKTNSFIPKKVVPSQKIKNFKGIIANGDLNMTGGNLSLGDTNYYSEKPKKNGNHE